MKPAESFKHRTEIELTIPESWIRFVTRLSEGFSPQCYGYWAYGADISDVHGWLVFEIADGPRPSEETITEMRGLVEAGGALPPGWFKFDRDFAIRAFVEGAKRWGVDWWLTADYHRYDIAVQLAAVGEVRYG